MRPFISFCLGLVCLLLGLTYHADSLPAKPTAAPQPVSVSPFVQAGCACGDKCECEALRAENAVLRAKIATLEAATSKQNLQVEAVKEATPTEVALAPAGWTCGPNGCYQTPRHAATRRDTPRRVVVQQPVRRGLFGRRK